MKLADTHTIIWLTEKSPELSGTAYAALLEARGDGGIALSAMSLMEIARLDQKRRITLTIPVLEYLKHLETLCVILPLTAEIAVRAVSFSSSYPRDPADRAIGATALIHGLPLITRDGPIRNSHEVPCLW